MPVFKLYGTYKGCEKKWWKDFMVFFIGVLGTTWSFRLIAFVWSWTECSKDFMFDIGLLALPGFYGRLFRVGISKVEGERLILFDIFYLFGLARYLILRHRYKIRQVD